MPQFAQLKEIVNQDIKGHSSKREREWLRSAPVALFWYEELHALVSSLDDQIATRRRRLAPLKPLSGTNATPEYLKAKHEFDEWHGRALHVLSRTKSRMQDARLAIRVQGLDMPQKTVIDVLYKILDITESDTDDAEDLLANIQNYVDTVLTDWAHVKRQSAAS
jgi:hypothetical protein